MARGEELTDKQWAVIEPHLPELPSREDGRGRPWWENREVMNGILVQRCVQKKTATLSSSRQSLNLLVEQRGLEPLTSALRTRRSAKLSYCPTRG